MTLVTPSLVFYSVSSASTSILMLQTLLLTSTTLLVIRVLPPMTQVSSTAPTFPSRWSVPLERTPSSPRLALRLVTVLLLTPSLKAQTLVSAHLLLTQTVTTEESKFRTSCDSSSHISQRSFGTSFFYGH